MVDWLFYAFETVAWPPHPLFLGRGGRGSGLMQAVSALLNTGFSQCRFDDINRNYRILSR